MARKGALFIVSLHKNDFGLENIQHKPTLNTPLWLQEPLVYIDLNLVTISQLPPKIWPKKGPTISQKWAKSHKSAEKINNKITIIKFKTHLGK